MKRNIYTIFVASLLTLGLVFTPVVLANTGTGDGSDDIPKNEELTEEQKEAFKQKIEAKKQEIKLRLEALESKALVAKCLPVQTVVAQVVEKIGKRSPKRAEIFSKLNEKLKGLVDKLETSSINTDDLENAITILEGKINTLNTDIEADKAALENVKNVDCESDPNSFKSALEAARTAHQKVIDDTADIKTYVKNDLKPILVEIRQQFNSSNESAEGDD